MYSGSSFLRTVPYRPLFSQENDCSFIKREDSYSITIFMEESYMADRLSIKFYICKHCGNIVGMINDSGVVHVCCGEKMSELVPNTTDAAKEKHVPVITVKGNEVHVAVGSVAHPMEAEHYIQW